MVTTRDVCSWSVPYAKLQLYVDAKGVVANGGDRYYFALTAYEAMKVGGHRAPAAARAPHISGERAICDAHAERSSTPTLTCAGAGMAARARRPTLQAGGVP